MWATWTNTAAGSVDCVVHLNPAVWTNWRVDDHAFQWFCDTMTHELGHFLGHADAGQRNPGLITYPTIDPESPNYNSVPQCRHRVLWFGHERISTFTEPGVFGRVRAVRPLSRHARGASGARGR